MMKKNIVLLIGGNMGDRLSFLKKTIHLLCEQLGKIKQQSSIYETTAWGFESEDFFNMALVLETKHGLLECLDITQGIEKELGRKQKSKNENYSRRCMDIDIIFYENLIYNDDRLNIPHPRMLERKFVLIPLNEILRDYIHPLVLKTIGTLLSECEDQSEVKKINEHI